MRSFYFLSFFPSFFHIGRKKSIEGSDRRVESRHFPPGKKRNEIVERMMRPGELPHDNIGKGEITRHYDVIYVQLFLITPRYSPIVRLIKWREFYFSFSPPFSFIPSPGYLSSIVIFMTRNRQIFSSNNRGISIQPRTTLFISFKNYNTQS